MDEIPSWVTQIGLVVYVLVVVFMVVLERRRPTSTLAWIFALVFVPIAGLVAYVFIGRNRVRRRVRRRARREVNPTEAVADVAHVRQPPARLPPPLDGLVRLAIATAAAPLRHCDDARLLPDPAAAFEAMEDAIRAARRCVHLQFYIWRDDDAGRSMIAALTERARAGVRVRLLYDDFGSLGTSRSHFAPLVEAGGEVRPWGKLKVRLRLARSRLNFRNHRKLVTIDGNVGFTGGLNVGDEYRGTRRNGSVWNDLLVRISGDAVLGLDAIFAEDWLGATDELLEDPAASLHAGAVDAEPSTGPMVQIIASGPDYPVASAVASQFAAAISASRDRCWITTPYFIPDPALMLILRTAAMRGVDVRLLVPAPRENDSQLVGWAARSYYDDLLIAGVRVFEWSAGMIHAKSMVVDDCVAAVGSANFDVRSLYINYEVTAMFYDVGIADSLAQVFEDDLAGAREVQSDRRAQRGVTERLAESFARVMSPLM